MKIKITRAAHINTLYLGHAHLYAWSENPEKDFFLTADGKKATELTFNFYPTPADVVLKIFPDSVRHKLHKEHEKYTRSALRLTDIITHDKNVEDKNTVILASDVSFADFTKKLIDLGYDTNKAWKLKTNSCVDAVQVLLKDAAKIPLDFPTRQRHFKHVGACFWATTDLLTSSELLRNLKEFKQRQEEKVVEAVSISQPKC